MVGRLICTFCRLSLTSYVVSFFLISHPFMACSLWGWALFDCGFSSFNPFFCSFLQFFISCRTILLFQLWCYLTQAYWASLGLLLILLSMTQYDHWAFYYIASGLLCPIYFLLSILGSFTFLEHPRPFLNRHSHGLLLTPLDFPNPITLSFILGAHGLSISPLLSLLALLQACCIPFSLFHIAYCPFSLWAPLGPFASSSPICLFYGIMIHYSCHLDLVVFLSNY